MTGCGGDKNDLRIKRFFAFLSAKIAIVSVTLADPSKIICNFQPKLNFAYSLSGVSRISRFLGDVSRRGSTRASDGNFHFLLKK
jgi:hypothetical protein